MRLLFAVLILLMVGLLAEGVFDSQIGAWIAFGSLLAILAMKLLGWIGWWPDSWADGFDGD